MSPHAWGLVSLSAQLACSSTPSAPSRVDAAVHDAARDASANHAAPHREAGPRDAAHERDALPVNPPRDAVACRPVDAGPLFGDALCNACLASACCQPTAQCFLEVDGGVSPCASLTLCVSACVSDGGADASTAGCEASCGAVYPAGIGLAENVNDCLNLNCTGDAGNNACQAN